MTAILKLSPPLLLLPFLILVVAAGAANARPLSPFFSEIFTGLSLEAIKNAGPSPGDNHAKINGYFLGGKKASAGPSPGDNHAKINGYFLGGKKASAGPSPGDKHAKINGFVLGGMKDTGPSPGEGHSYVHGGGGQV